jgi:hypothetical protein
LINEWLSASQRPSAWISLDPGNNDPARFLAYLVGADGVTTLRGPVDDLALYGLLSRLRDLALPAVVREPYRIIIIFFCPQNTTAN